MPLEVFELGKAPAATRRRRRLLETSTEWSELKTKLANGIGQSEEVAVTFNANDKARLGLRTLKRAFRDLAKTYIKKLRLPYSVDAYSTEDGREIILIRNEVVVTSRPGAQEEHVVAASAGKSKKRRRA